MISIIIPTFNHCDDLLKPCINSVLRNTTMNNVELIIVANGCTDNTKQYLDSFNFKSLWYDKPLGFPKAINEGIKNISNDSTHILLLNNDCLLLEQPKDLWINILLSLFHNPKVGIVGPLKLYDNDVMQYYIQFFIAMIKREVIQKIGLLDETFCDGNCEDADYCIRAKINGYEIANAPVTFNLATTMKLGQFPIFHIAHATTCDIKGFSENVKNNLITLKNRYKDLPPEKFEKEVYC